MPKRRACQAFCINKVNQMDLRTFFGCLKIIGKITLTWHSDSKTNDSKCTFINFMLYSTITLNVLCMTTQILKIKWVDDDLVKISKSVSIISIVFDSSLRTILTKIQWPKIKASFKIFREK